MNIGRGEKKRHVKTRVQIKSVGAWQQHKNQASQLELLQQWKNISCNENGREKNEDWWEKFRKVENLSFVTN